MFIATSIEDNFILNVFIALRTCFKEFLVIHDEDFSSDEGGRKMTLMMIPMPTLEGKNMTRMMKMTTIMIMIKRKGCLRERKKKRQSKSLFILVSFQVLYLISTCNSNWFFQ